MKRRARIDWVPEMDEPVRHTRFREIGSATFTPPIEIFDAAPPPRPFLRPTPDTRAAWWQRQLGWSLVFVALELLVVVFFS
jgi:hypothetical protein